MALYPQSANKTSDTMYKKKDQAAITSMRINKRPKRYTCTICGHKDDLNSYDPDCELLNAMYEQGLCYHCAFWLDKLNNRPTRSEIIGGNMYIINPMVHKPLNKIKGFFGTECYILKDDMEVARTNNMWNIGKVPDRFLGQAPDTAKFIPMAFYKRLLNNPFRCRAKGCYDRYKCVRYDMDTEKDGAFNKIPRKHKTGDEKCPSFLNKNEIKTRPWQQ